MIIHDLDRNLPVPTRTRLAEATWRLNAPCRCDDCPAVRPKHQMFNVSVGHAPRWICVHCLWKRMREGRG